MRATQTEMEAATSANTTVSPSVQHYHPSAAKAWGMITPNTTVSASYPAAGVSVVKNSTGDFTVTHGVTFSSTAYMAVVSLDAGGSRMYLHDMVKATTTLRLVFTDQDGFAKDPSSFNYALFGDL